MLLYLYDLKIKGKKPYNNLKRRFYYQLKNSPLSTKPWKTKSAILVEDYLEGEADAFFKKFEGFVEVYKAKIESIEQLSKP
ncbi:MAG: hypothetical protein QXF56_02620 [Candidatus Micrarchaeia archaeon]